MAFFEITLLYGTKKKAKQYSCRLIASNLLEAVKKAETDIYLETGMWQNILSGLATEIQYEDYFLIPEL